MLPGIFNRETAGRTKQTREGRSWQDRGQFTASLSGRVTCSPLQCSLFSSGRTIPLVCPTFHSVQKTTLPHFSRSVSSTEGFWVHHVTARCLTYVVIHIQIVCLETVRCVWQVYGLKMYNFQIRTSFDPPSVNRKIWIRLFTSSGPLGSLQRHKHWGTFLPGEIHVRPPAPPPPNLRNGLHNKQLLNHNRL